MALCIERFPPSLKNKNVVYKEGDAPWCLKQARKDLLFVSMIGADGTQKIVTVGSFMEAMIWTHGLGRTPSARWIFGYLLDHGVEP